MSLKLGFVGSGYMGQLAHIGNYSKIEDIELDALAEGRPELARKVADRYGIQDIYPTHREMLEKADIDAVVAIMHFGLHHAVVPDILNAGKHLLTEKAICIRPETAHKLADLAEEKNLTYMVAYMKRSDPGSRHAKKLIDEWIKSGEMGQMRYIRCTAAMAGDWTWGIESHIQTEEPIPPYEGATHEPAPEWMTEEQGRSFSGFVNFWIHQVNLVRYLSGENYQVTHVTPDGLLLVAETDSGVPITLEKNTNQINGQWMERVTVCFDKAEIELKLGAPMQRQHAGEVRVTTECATGQEDRLPFLPPAWAFEEQARNYVKTLKGELSLISPARHAALDLEIAEQYIRMLGEAG